MSRTLITGGSGLLGPYLAAAGDNDTIRISGLRRGDVACDLRRKTDAHNLIEAEAPDILINCCALTNVDQCEADPRAAFALNETAVRNLATALPANATLVQISTDQVYPDRPGPHNEEAAAPVNVYGRSKLAGEAAALEHPESLVLRVNFFGPSKTEGRASLSDWMTRAFQAREPITLFTDSLFTPLLMSTLAATIMELVARGARGIFNVGSRNGMSKHRFGLKLAEELGLDASCAMAGRAAGVSGRASRPPDLRMDVTKTEAFLGRPMPSLASEISRLGRS